MPKRNYATDDEGIPISNSSTKRPRTADSDQEEDDLLRTQTRPKRETKDKGKGKARAKDSDDDEKDVDELEDGDNDDDDDVKPQDMDDEQLDAQYGAAIRAQLENKKNVQEVSIRFAYLFLLSQLPCRALLTTASSNISR